MSEWKDLNITDLSECPDILVGNYEFQYWCDEEWRPSIIGSQRLNIFHELLSEDGIVYRYRKVEPKAPTWEETYKKLSTLISEKLNPLKDEFEKISKEMTELINIPPEIELINSISE